MKKFIVLLTLIFCLTGSMISYAGTWVQDSNGWKYRDDDGTMLKDTFIRIHPSENYYYFDSNGYMCTGITTIEGNEYCFSEDGILQCNGTTSDGRLLDSTGQVIEDANDGYTFFVDIKTEKGLGNNSRYIVVVLKNECNKSFTVRPTCTLMRDGKEITLNLLDIDKKEVGIEKEIKPYETTGFSFLASDYSEFFVDENSRLQMYFIFDNEDFSCTTKIAGLRRGHFSLDAINQSKNQE